MCATVAKASRAITLFDVSPQTYKGIVKALGDRPFRVSYDERILRLESSILHDVDWQTYSKLVRAFGDKHFRHTYQKGTLEIMMSPSLEHERIKGFLGRLVETMALECRIWIVLAGSTTQRSKPKREGLEPDESYYIRPKRPTKEDFPDATTAPDLAIEIDLRKAKLERARTYAELGVRELWRYHYGTMEILRPAAGFALKPSEKSALLPYLTASDLTRFVRRMQETDENQATIEFIAWLRKQIKQTKRSARSRRKKET